MTPSSVGARVITATGRSRRPLSPSGTCAGPTRTTGSTVFTALDDVAPNIKVGEALGFHSDLTDLPMIECICERGIVLREGHLAYDIDIASAITLLRQTDRAVSP